MAKVVENWRRHIAAHAEETLDFYSGEPKRVIKWHVYGPNQAEDAERMRLGLVCMECLSVFPAAPEIKNLSIWKKFAHEWAGLRSKDELISLISRNLCPTCTTQVNGEMFALSYRGLDEFAPRPLEDIIND